MDHNLLIMNFLTRKTITKNNLKTICVDWYYFDDGKIAFESINATKVIEKKPDKQFVFVGNGYFRFVYEHRFHTLQYSLNDKKLQGTLGNLWGLYRLNYIFFIGSRNLSSFIFSEWNKRYWIDWKARLYQHT